MKEIKDMSDVELAAYVATHLRSKKIDVVLSGGACVSIHSSRKYVSMDLDMVNKMFAPRNRIRAAMAEIGFEEYNRYFRHPDTEYLVEFPAGPLAVGDEPVKQIDELTVATGTLRLLSPTDCVKDRLSWYFHNNDLQCLEQAILVAQQNEIDLKEIERWSKAEGKLGEFKHIRHRLIRE
jgi:hypothetical protein